MYSLNTDVRASHSSRGEQFAFHVACRGVCFVSCTLASKYAASLCGHPQRRESRTNTTRRLYYHVLPTYSILAIAIHRCGKPYRTYASMLQVGECGGGA